MKKATKQKIKSKLQKLKKPLMILSLVGNILFLLFIIVGCVGSKKQAQQTNADNSPLITLRDTSWQLNSVIDYTPNGVLLNADELGTNYTESYHLYYTSPQFPDKQFVNLGFSITYDDEDGADFSYIYGYYLSDYGSQRRQNFLVISPYGSTDDYYWDFGTYPNYTGGLQLNVDGSYHINSDTENQALMNWFFTNSTLVNADDVFVNTFEFLSQINYNGTFGQPLDSMFVNASNESYYTKYIALPYFRSNGQYFNQIVVRYLNGGSMGYIDSNGQTATNTNNQTWYFLEMEYENTDTGLSVAVNYRNFRVATNTYLDKGSTWKAASYRVITFQGELTPQQRADLECFNNDYFSGFSGDTNDVGLGNVFTLMKDAFGGLTSLMSIQILPNITIGLLLFLPLIVMVIISVVWLIKS